MGKYLIKSGFGCVDRMLAAVVDIYPIAGESAAVKIQSQIGGHILQKHGGAAVEESIVVEHGVGGGIAGA